MATLALTPTLYDAEESLTALLDTAELVTPDQDQAFLADLEAALTTATDKRDRVAHRLAKLEVQQAFAAAEIKRLHEFKRSAEAQQEQLEGYVSYVIQRLGKDAKGKWRKLEGNSSTMFLRACASSVEITTEADIPLDYKSATVKMSAAMWLDVLNSLNTDFPLAYETELTVDKRAVKASIDAGVEVPGAKLITDKTTLGRK
jgi:hypothetical protein